MENKNNDINVEIDNNEIVKNELIEKSIQDKKQKVKVKEKICNVCFIKNNKLMLDFNGYGIEIILDNDYDKSKIKNSIKVKYKSEIGKPDFEAFI